MSSINNLKDRLKDIGYKTTITLSNDIQLLKGSGSFVIPDYQRGYVWGQRKKNSQSDSVSFLINSLKESFTSKIMRLVTTLHPYRKLLVNKA